MAGLRIREAGTADAAALAGLAVQLGHQASDPARVAQYLSVASQRSDGVTLVAELDSGRVVGVARAVEQHFVVDAPFVELAALVVDADARGTGVGAALLAAVETWTRGRGITTLDIHSNVVRERAHHFYLREGCAEVKRQVVFRKSL